MTDLGPIWLEWPHTRIRRELRTERGEVVRFVAQLEYNPSARYDVQPPSEWMVVARFDHDRTSAGGHDIAEEGLHLDIYRDGERYRRSWDFPRVPLPRAMDYCESYLEKHSDRLLARFDEWHEFNVDY